SGNGQDRGPFARSGVGRRKFSDQPGRRRAGRVSRWGRVSRAPSRRRPAETASPAEMLPARSATAPDRQGPKDGPTPKATVAKPSPAVHNGGGRTWRTATVTPVTTDRKLPPTSTADSRTAQGRGVHSGSRVPRASTVITTAIPLAPPSRPSTGAH